MTYPCLMSGKTKIFSFYSSSQVARYSCFSHTHTHHPHTLLLHSWFTLLDTTTDTLISLLVLLYATVHAYRTTYLIAAYITLTAIKAFTN